MDVQVGAAVDQEAFQAELAYLQEWARKNPIKVPIQPVRTGSGSGDEIRDEVLKRGDL